VTLRVIGSGLGRTGTLSLKLALDQLGFGPCHHMREVLEHPESVPLWIDAFEGRPDWEAMFEGYNSTIDAPGCKFWRELSEYYPQAKVLHSIRDPDAWFDSTQNSIFAPDAHSLNPKPPYDRFFAHSLRPYQGGIHDRAFMTDYFRRHSVEVERTIPSHRLLVYEVSQGWGPLCAFLGVQVPDAPFPLTNTREEFAARTAARNAARSSGKP
jgi:Sulfotransferase domain